MITVRAPFRIPLGGGSTDLPAYYREHGGFIFAAALNLYMYIHVDRPLIDDLVHIKYRGREEIVEDIEKLDHQLAREALRLLNIRKNIEIVSMADVPDGTGMGTSGSYLVALLLALHAYKNEVVSAGTLAEEASHIIMEVLKLPDGKQDQYAAALGGFLVLDIEPNGRVNLLRPPMARSAIERFQANSMLFYTGVQRSSAPILAAQDTNEGSMVRAKHDIKRIGHEILAAFQAGDLNDFGRLMDRHWEVKKRMLSGMTTDRFDTMYALAKSRGALGGKIMGAGGGGFFLIYADDDHAPRVRKAMREEMGLRELPWELDYEGAKILSRVPRTVRGYQPVFV
jgi:D-glycero-alpha-D-manno-heptose-7-phosphate kinase